MNIERYHKECAWQSGFTICNEGEKFSIISDYIDMLITFSKKNKELKGISLDYYPFIESMYLGYCFHGNEIFMAPYNGNNFMVTNLDNNTTRTIDQLSKYTDQKNSKYLKIIRVGEKACVIGESIHKILIVDMNRDYKCELEHSYSDDILWTFNHLVIGAKVLLVSRSNTCLIVIDVKTNIIDEYNFSDDVGSGFSDIYGDENKVVLVGNNGQLFEWNNGNTLKKIANDADKIISWFSFKKDENVYRLHANEGILSIITNDKERNDITIDIGEKISGICFQGVCVSGDSIIIVARNGRIVDFCMQNNTIEEVILSEYLNYEKTFNTAFEKMINKSVVVEGKNGGLNSLLNYIMEN